jgi:hypothetical protein
MEDVYKTARKAEDIRLVEEVGRIYERRIRDMEIDRAIADGVPESDMPTRIITVPVPPAEVQAPAPAEKREKDLHAIGGEGIDLVGKIRKANL